MKTVLVTGGVGYIGSHTSVALIESGYDIVIVDDLSNTRLDLLEGIKKITGKDPKFYEGDLKDEKLVAKIFNENQIDAIIHFAASKAVGESVTEPLKYYKNNFLSLVNLLEQAVSASIPLVFSSSCTVYGTPDLLPVTEQTPVKPAQSPYGNTKQVGEEIIVDTIAANPNFKAISLRYFNPIGAHESSHIGELPLGVPNNLVPYLLQVAAGERECLSVFGDDYNTPDGTCIRDYIHVVDLAEAHVVAVKRMLDGLSKEPYEVFNLGTGQGNSVLELIKVFEEVNGLKLNYKIVDRRAGDVEQIYADTTFANEELGWKSRFELPDMLRSAWNWQKNLSKLG
ncbi:UDP-glucose 4-epimerase GalE [Marinoscillum sp. MHG1-6]|uniref:UDP-glucose 4-epimerase GalE n=1 Tax=Marinoscillum sp. MHG1-6 TaxID=2959627 RepID=UPI0021581BFB|nr:UDP-glucose 4-epimerase GalE [Marinoscillum sp. MHG1-6]